ncbi:Poly polymerase 1 [Diplonema papillatum]|nr:Poly polymerase 1 [Diplonema papillatum]|eukprot:gene22215-34091_t
MPKEPKAGANDELASLFTELAQMETMAGNTWPVRAYQKVATALRSHAAKITSGKQAMKIPNVGKASADKIQEFLDTGSIQKLEDLREEYGDLGVPVSMKSMKGTPLTAAQKKEIRNVGTTLSSRTIPVLKQELSLNHQKVTGTKPELLERIGEGRVLGAAPKCPLCGLGFLKFNSATGMYSCPGGFDDDVYRPCAYLSGDVKREKWQKLTPPGQDDDDDEDEDDDEEDSVEEEAPKPKSKGKAASQKKAAKSSTKKRKADEDSDDDDDEDEEEAPKPKSRAKKAASTKKASTKKRKVDDDEDEDDEEEDAPKSKSKAQTAKKGKSAAKPSAKKRK